MAGQDGGCFDNSKDNSVIEYNAPVANQPGLWCQWNPSEDGTEIVWDGSEKFYNYVEWIEYLIDTFLEPWGYKVNGSVVWQGEDTGDVGVIEVKDNVVTKHEGVVSVPTAPQEVGRSLVQSELVLDLIKLRNKLASTKKGTKVAAKWIDEFIAKYEA
jgi:hypothetical protein